MRSLQQATVLAPLAPLSEIDPPQLPDVRTGNREWTISEMSRSFGLTLRALRFYEARGLIAPKRFGGARYYTERDRARLKLILGAKQMGFTLTEAASLIGRATDGETAALPLSAETMQNQIRFLEGQKTAIDGALTQLKGRLCEMQTA